MTSFAGKTVLITGATSGMGEAIALAFADQGARLFVTGRNRERGNRLVSEIGNKSAKGIFVPGDITDRDFCEQLVTQCVDDLGGLDAARTRAVGHLCFNSDSLLDDRSVRARPGLPSAPGRRGFSRDCPLAWFVEQLPSRTPVAIA